MFEHKKILDKIEKLVEQLPYRSVRIEVELPEQTLRLSIWRGSAEKMKKIL